jgi:ribonucleoside-triphosphate reductase
MTGKSHTEDGGTEFAMKLMKRLRKATDGWKEITGIHFASGQHRRYR